MWTALRDLQTPTDHDAATADVQDGGGVDMVAVRAWARSRGYPIDETSGVPLDVLRTYRRVHGASPGATQRSSRTPSGASVS